MEVKDLFNVDVYCCNVEVIFTDDIEKIVEELDELYGDAENLHHAEGFVYANTSELYYLVFDNRYLSHNTVGHELFHLACMITADRDIEDEEARCWLNGYLHSTTYKLIKEHKIDLKDE